MPRELQRALGLELIEALHEQDPKRYSDFFLGRASPRLGERPVRSAYWFGLLVARGLAQSRTLAELANADVIALRPTVEAELRRIVENL